MDSLERLHHAAEWQAAGGEQSCVKLHVQKSDFRGSECIKNFEEQEHKNGKPVTPKNSQLA